MDLGLAQLDDCVQMNTRGPRGTRRALRNRRRGLPFRWQSNRVKVTNNTGRLVMTHSQRTAHANFRNP